MNKVLTYLVFIQQLRLVAFNQNVEVVFLSQNSTKMWDILPLGLPLDGEVKKKNYALFSTFGGRKVEYEIIRYKLLKSRNLAF